MDIVIEGDGFFQILLPDGGVRYTRDGAFKMDSDGRLTTSDGFPLEPEIIVPSDAIDFSVGSDGTVSVMRLALVSLRQSARLSWSASSILRG